MGRVPADRERPAGALDELIEEVEVDGHVGGEDGLDDRLATVLPHLGLELGEEVELRVLLEQLEELGRVHRLEGRLVVVEDGEVVAHGDQVVGADAWVAEVVRRRREHAHGRL